jgi:hypothetical protein
MSMALEHCCLTVLLEILATVELLVEMVVAFWGWPILVRADFLGIVKEGSQFRFGG